MDWETLYCPDKQCQKYGIPFAPGFMVKHGSSHGQKQAKCKAWRSSVALRYRRDGTVIPLFSRRPCGTTE